ncbi:hypothetical protein EXU85_15445 [Spirosoma sp. KCTC 42546]|uniref:glycoside hydrolase family 20 zincin-like fold domain-containing protein n=1 Tax=Spirosoma sp. KCTC 42546 TaxID=2520506 RepID=UPI001156DABA|nr:glycoside hydrolase family 20 zincin-like fold domain-containing protein [Spirosoma sp. KCTC 42546]QDK79928.1 hypothetical protein EXU85_15445 [Spirosoma sp. KCTC 42546]
MKNILILISLWIGICPSAFSQRVNMIYDHSLPQAEYAVRMLEKTFQKQGQSSRKEASEYVIRLSLNATAIRKEAYSIQHAGNQITIEGGDERGLLYGCLSLCDEVKNGVSLQKIRASHDQTNLPFRAIKFNLPWDAYREGEAMSLHQETCRDLRFWEAFLDMMAQNRFNALTLWNLHPFPYMIRPTNFPEASPFPEAELAGWQALYRGIFRLAKERGIDTYLVNWNIFVSPEFAKAHNVAISDPQKRIHYGAADTSEIIRRYTRECVTQVLNEYPDLSGLGFTHGEAMVGMTPQQRQDWFGETILEGMRRANRKAKLIHRVPLEAGTNVGGSTSVSTEQLTRKAMEQLDFVEGPIWAEIKFNWSHGHSSTRLIKVHGGKLNDTYFKPQPTNYKIAWMVRNEDFFCLRWGVPDFIRQHIATNTQPYVGGYFVGSEGYIPAKDYFTKADQAHDWQYAFERQWLFYQLWGRLLYNPATSDGVFKAEFVRRYGKGTEGLLEAYALASSTPLRLASAFDFTWDFSLYSEGFMAMNQKSMAYISIDRQISQAPADANYVSVAEYVKTLSAGGSFAKSRITPLMLSQVLERDCQKALDLVKSLKSTGPNSLRYEVADVQAWANLGLYYAQKLRGAVALQTYRLTGGEANKTKAISCLEKALHFWDEVVTITRPLYNDMPLAAYSYPHDGKRAVPDPTHLFHWEKLRPAVANDIEIARNALVSYAK